MQQIHGREALTRLAPDDPWFRWALPSAFERPGFVDADVAVVPREGRLPGWWVVPFEGVPDEPGRMERAFARLHRRLGSDRPGMSLSVPAAYSALAERWWRLDEGARWDWMWTTSSPAAADRRDLVEFDDHDDADELRAFTAAHHPRPWAEIGTGVVRRWLGARDAAGALVAVGGVQDEGSGAPHLTGILVAAQARRQGWGRLISAALTADAVDSAGVCTLGLFADNASARSVYSSLGYRLARRWSSRSVVPG